ncbi:MAG: hypothetical protein EOM26_10725 [Alphaproteobacteria bacterium]|nr:hypothetical protein [Alphaproteobacteria bacterium]
MRKILETVFHPPVGREPGPFYYPQSDDFTCGAAALIMAMKAVKPDLVVSRELEFEIWREANNVYMGTGHPGTNPFGLAQSARKRGFEAAVLVNEPENLFTTWNRITEKRLVSRALMAFDFLQCRKSGTPVYQGPFGIEQLGAFDNSAVVVLTGSGIEKHWLLLVSIDDASITVHDPWRDTPNRIETRKSMFRTIPRKEFAGLLGDGAGKAQAAIIVHGRRQPVPFPIRTTMTDSFKDEGLVSQIAESVPFEIPKRQVTDFTCGPHCLCLLQKDSFRSKNDILLEELRIWREANMVFAGSSLPGCGPYGLALAAMARGMKVALWGHQIVGLLLEKTKDPVRREIQTIMEGHDRARLLRAEVPISEGRFGLTELAGALGKGARIVLLVESGRYGHWILMQSIEDDCVRYVDPWIDSGDTQTKPRGEFRKWMKFGPRRSQAAIIVY